MATATATTITDHPSPSRTTKNLFLNSPPKIGTAESTAQLAHKSERMIKRTLP
jgi:hypothetical protein